MNCQLTSRRCRRPTEKGLTILEVAFALGLIMMLVIAVYSAIGSGMSTIRMARENLRATQILIEKTEALRLYNWEQLNGGYLSTNFVVNYDVNVANTNSGVLYHGSIDIQPAKLGTTYEDEMRVVTVRLNWQTGTLPRRRELTTYVCRSGLQNYKY